MIKGSEPMPASEEKLREYFARNLTHYRKALGLTQIELAEKLNYSDKSISKWERGESSPDTDNLIALAELYHMTLDQLLGGEPSPLTPPQPAPRQAAAVAQPAEQPKTKEKRHALHGKLGKSLFKFPFPVVVAIVYVALGMTVGWHPTWLVFLLIPIYYHFAGACMTKSQKAFMMAQPIPEVIITVFLVLGVCAKLWLPAWVLFLIIPVYYWLVAVYVKKPKKK